MIQISSDLKDKYQNEINYKNADTMFAFLSNLINTYGKEQILRIEFETEEECISNYVIKSNVIRFATESIEHYIKAILIQNGESWNDARSWGHNLLELFEHLDEDSKNIIISALLPLNQYEYKDYNYSNNNEFSLIFKLLLKYGCISEDEFENNIKFSQLDYKNENNLYSKYPTFQNENVVPLKSGQIVYSELSELEHNDSNNSRRQLLNIRARFPGQYIVDVNVEFLISLAYAMNELSEYYRKKNDESLNV